MNIILAVIPFLISFALGILCLSLMTRLKKDVGFLLLSWGTGLGLSGLITFTSLLLFNQFHRGFILTAHIFLLGILFTYIHTAKKKRLFNFSFNTTSYVLLFVSLLCVAPSLLQGLVFPEGGWDAWAVWNFKAKMIFLGGPNWQNIFNPILARTSPHYQLLLPLINAWGWIFLKQTNFLTPALTSMVFTFLTAGLFIKALQEHAGTKIACLSALVLATLPSFYKLASSQYADLLIGFYILAAFYCLLKLENDYIILGGISLGFLSFLKPEAFIQSVLILFLFSGYFFFSRSIPEHRLKTGRLILAAGLTMLPAILFQWLYAPANITFINGLTSQTHPSSILRFQIILAFYLVELVSWKWSGLWILLTLIMILRFKSCFRAPWVVAPVFLLIYGGILTFYYYLNTHFEIIWWVQNTITRLIFALTPLTVFWIIGASFSKAKEKSTGA